MDKKNLRFDRTILVLGKDAAESLHRKKVLIIGVGGVGGHAAENIIRGGIGNAVFVDGDKVDISNCNRQITALSETIGAYKAEILAARCRQINPDGKFTAVNRFIKSREDISELIAERFDFVVDAIDDVPMKTEIICQLKSSGIPFVSAMGAGGKIRPDMVSVSDISKTYNCPLARTMRSRLKKVGITKGVRCVFSSETPIKSTDRIGSISYMPALFGCFCAAEAIRVLAEMK